MFELIVLAQKVVAVVAVEDATAVTPHVSLTLDADGIYEWAGAGVRLQALTSVADPRLAEVANSSHHCHARGVVASVLDNTVSRLHHALSLATVAALWQALHAVAKVAEGAVLLPTVALFTFHCKVAWLISKGPVG